MLVGFQAQVQPAAAAPVTFTIDATRSLITLSGNVVNPDFGTLPFTAQATGSLAASYTGTLLADLAPPNILFSGGSMIAAENNGTWEPAVGGGSDGSPGSAPADYGGKISGLGGLLTGYFAGRNFQLDATSSTAVLSNGGFDAGLITTTFLTNATPAPSTDYNVAVSIDPSDDSFGSTALTGSSPNTPSTSGFLTNAFNVTNVLQKLTMVIPVNITNVSTNSDDVITVVLNGAIVATAASTNWPVQVSVGVQNGHLALTWFSIPGQSYTVQSTQNLRASWATATGGVMTTNANTTTWTASAPASTEFYRVHATF